MFFAGLTNKKPAVAAAGFSADSGLLFGLFLRGAHDDLYEVLSTEDLLGHGLYVGVGERPDHLLVIFQVFKPRTVFWPEM